MSNPYLEDLIKRVEAESIDLPSDGSSGSYDGLKAFGAGAAQGALFNFGDELLAGIVAPFVDESYRELQEQYEAEDNRLAQQNPLAYGAGTVSGAIAVPGVGLGKAGVGLTKALNVGPKLAKAANYAAQGGTAGLLDYLGRTDVQDMSVLDAAKTTARAGIGGVVLGKTLENAIPVAKNLIKRVDDSRTAQDIKEVFDVVERVKNDPRVSTEKLIGSVSFVNEASNRLRDTATKTAKDLINAEQVLSTAYNKILDDASKAVGDKVKIDVQPKAWLELLNRLNTTVLSSGVSEGKAATELAQYLNKVGVLELDQNGKVIEGISSLPLNKAKQLIYDLELMLSQNPALTNEVYSRGLPRIGYSNLTRNQGRSITKMLQNSVNEELQKVDPTLAPKLEKIKSLQEDIATFKGLTNLEDFYYGDPVELAKDVPKFIEKVRGLNDPGSANPTGSAVRNLYERISNGDINKFLGDKDIINQVKENLKSSGRSKYISEYEGLVQRYNENLANLKEDVLFADLGGVAQQQAALGASGRGNFGISARGLITQGTAITAEGADALRSTIEGLLISKRLTKGVLQSPKFLADVLGDAGMYNYLSKLAHHVNKPKIASMLEALYKTEGKKRAATLYVMLQTPAFKDFINSFLIKDLEQE